MIESWISGSISTDIAQHGSVQVVIKGRTVTNVRLSANPIIVHGLVCFQYDGISLASEYLDRIHDQRVSTNSINLDNSEVVTIDCESVIWVAGYRNNTESISLSFLDCNRREVRQNSTGVATHAVNKDGIWCWGLFYNRCCCVIPDIKFLAMSLLKFPNVVYQSESVITVDSISGSQL